MPGWITNTLREPALDLGKAGAYSLETTDTLLKGFDANVAGARTALQETADSAWGATWIDSRRANALERPSNRGGTEPYQSFTIGTS